MQAVTGLRSDGQVFHHEGYVYLKDHIAGDKAYYHCQERQCNGRILWVLADAPQPTSPHNHLPRWDTVRILQFKERLRDRAANELLSLRTIYNEEQALDEDLALLVGPFRSMKCIMKTARRSFIPPIPRDLEEINRHLLDPRFRNRFATEIGPQERPFYDGFLQTPQEPSEKIILFTSPTVREITMAMREVRLYMDATFSVVPRAGGDHQLFCLHVVIQDITFPLVFALMERKSQSSYVALLRHIRDVVLPGIEPMDAMSNYDAALCRAVGDVFPNARLKGCWFHYARAIYRKSRQLGLTGHGNVTPNVAQGVRMAMCLALLPQATFAQGAREVVAWMNQGADHPTRLQTEAFHSHLVRQWANHQITVDEAITRTNNAVEAFHSVLLRLIGREYPNVWVFINCLQKMEHSRASDAIRVLRGENIRVPRRRQTRRLDHDLREAEAQLLATGDVGHFLRRMSHGMRRLVEEAFEPEQAGDLDLIPDLNPVPIPDPDRDIVLEPMVDIVPGRHLIPEPDADDPDLDRMPDPENPTEHPVRSLPPVEGLCRVCMSERATHAFIPCGHQCLCAGCAVEIERRQKTNCLICRNPSRDIIRIFV